MVKRDVSYRDIDWFKDQKTFKRINLNPDFQRFSVWSKGFKEFFLDTIIAGYPSPTIFLNKRKPDEGEFTFDVVDGKQRLEAIYEFLEGKTGLSKDHPSYPGLTFSDLPSEVQLAIENYDLPVEFISGASPSDLNEIFDRINRNVRKLNKQELRHAKYDGKFINLMESLAEDNFWENVGIRTNARVRAMRDIEFVSEIYLTAMHGIIDSDFKELDTFYAIYDEDERFSEVEAGRSLYDKCMSNMKKLGEEFIKSTRFTNLNDFYSLWAAIQELTEKKKAIDFDKTRTKLKKFSNLLNEPDKIPPSKADALEYSDAVRQGGNKKSTRDTRVRIVKKQIVTK
jgi:hypothetical protein